ncbi:acyl-CoA carboxylase subunit epsilon, partial [Streptosporangium sp. NPDC003464]
MSAHRRASGGPRPAGRRVRIQEVVPGRVRGRLSWQGATGRCGVDEIPFLEVVRGDPTPEELAALMTATNYGIEPAEPVLTFVGPLTTPRVV